MPVNDDVFAALASPARREVLRLLLDGPMPAGEIAERFDISLNAMTWIGRIGLIVLPPIVYVFTYRLCLGLEQHDREVLEHGIETGVIRRLPRPKARFDTDQRPRQTSAPAVPEPGPRPPVARRLDRR